MSRITMSKLPRLAICPASAVLPGVDASNPWSSAGTITHRFLERCAQVGREAALAEAPEDHRARLACIDLDGLPLGKEYAQEVTYAYDVATGMARRLGSGLGRDYSAASPTEIVGTADVDGPGEIDDYKTDHGHDELAPPPRDNLQLRALALAKSKVDGLPEVKARVIRIADDGSHREEETTLDFFDLEDTASELKRIWSAVESAKAQVAAGQMPSVRESAHCRYCPAQAVCPARTALIKQMAWTPQDLEAEVFSALTPETASRAFRQWRMAKDVLGKIEGAFRKYAEANPIDLGDGTVWGPVEKQKDTLSGVAVHATLAQLYGADVANSAVEIKATKTGIEEALREVKAKTGTPLAQLKRESMAAIGEAGGITTTTKIEFEIHKKEG